MRSQITRLTSLRIYKCAEVPVTRNKTTAHMSCGATLCEAIYLPEVTVSLSGRAPSTIRRHPSTDRPLDRSGILSCSCSRRVYVKVLAEATLKVHGHLWTHLKHSAIHT